MPRYAIVSDIHANLESLTAALERIPPSDAVLCLGDVVGYGPNPNECVALIRERATTTISGNHDLAACENYGIEYFNPSARTAMVWTQGVLAAEHAAWLKTLPYEHREPGFLMVHGAPVDYFTYILDNVDAARAFERTDAPLILVGHSHVAEYYARAADGSITHKHMQQGGTIELDPALRYIVNAGSVGQPARREPARVDGVLRSASAHRDLGALRLSDRAGAREDPRGAPPRGARGPAARGTLTGL